MLEWNGCWQHWCSTFGALALLGCSPGSCMERWTFLLHALNFQQSRSLNSISVFGYVYFEADASQIPSYLLSGDPLLAWCCWQMPSHSSSLSFLLLLLLLLPTRTLILFLTLFFQADCGAHPAIWSIRMCPLFLMFISLSFQDLVQLSESSKKLQRCRVGISASGWWECRGGVRIRWSLPSWQQWSSVPAAQSGCPTRAQPPWCPIARERLGWVFRSQSVLL